MTTILPRLILAVSFGAAFASGQTLMPLPTSMQQASGELRIDSAFRIGFAKSPVPRLARAGTRFLRQLSIETGIPLRNISAVDAAKATLVIDCDQNTDNSVDKLGDPEAYRLVVTPTQARLTSTTVLGAMRGLQTFLQLVGIRPEGFAARAVSINDNPRFPWRGLLIDVTSHFMPVPVILRTLDTMEAVKLNVFHWHLTDDQGFRVESKVFPNCTSLARKTMSTTRRKIFASLWPTRATAVSDYPRV